MLRTRLVPSRQEYGRSHARTKDPGGNQRSVGRRRRRRHDDDVMIMMMMMIDYLAGWLL